MARSLDRKKPFGTVHGGDFLHRYEQDGRYFDGDGNETGAPNEAAPGLTPPKLADAPSLDSGMANDGAGVQTVIGGSTLPESSPNTLALAAIGAAAPLLAKGAEEVIAELEDQSDGMLDMLAALEAVGKNRRTVLAAIAALKEQRAAPPAPPAAPAPAVAGAAAQMAAQLGA